MDANVVIDRLLNMYDMFVGVDSDLPANIARIASCLAGCNVSAEAVTDRVAKHRIWCGKAAALRLLEQPVQRSPEWFAMRNEMITASDIAQSLGAVFSAFMNKVFGARNAHAVAKQGEALCFF